MPRGFGRKEFNMTEKKSNKKVIAIVAIVLVVLIAVFGVIYANTRPEVNEGTKTVTVEVIHKDKSTNEFVCQTSAENLETVLLDAKIVEDNQTDWGLYIITADGETVNEDNQEWWCITKDGETLTTGATDTMVADGDHYELTFTEGY